MLENEGLGSARTTASDEFHMWLGYCIAEWAKLEEQLYLICRECLAAHVQSAIVFYRQVGLKAKFVMVGDLVKSILPEPEGKDVHADLKAWSEIVTNIDELMKFRNRLAHQPVYVETNKFQINGDDILIGGKTISFGVPNLSVRMSKHEKIHKPKKADDPITVSQMQEHLSSVRQQTVALKDFLVRLERHP